MTFWLLGKEGKKKNWNICVWVCVFIEKKVGGLGGGRAHNMLSFRRLHSALYNWWSDELESNSENVEINLLFTWFSSQSQLPDSEYELLWFLKSAQQNPFAQG